ncbi:hypothetical protein BLSTO_02159 [Blastocystis sp. subtype 1]
MSEDPRIVTCRTVRYYADCLATKAFPDLISELTHVAPFMPYDPCTLFVIEGKIAHGEEVEHYLQMPVVGSEFHEMRDGFVENGATLMEDGTPTCIMRIWKYYDYDGEFYISKAFVWGCHGNCPICVEKCKVLHPCNPDTCCHDCDCCHEYHCHSEEKE